MMVGVSQVLSSSTVDTAVRDSRPVAFSLCLLPLPPGNAKSRPGPGLGRDLMVLNY